MAESKETALDFVMKVKEEEKDLKKTDRIVIGTSYLSSDKALIRYKDKNAIEEK